MAKEHLLLVRKYRKQGAFSLGRSALEVPEFKHKLAQHNLGIKLTG